MLYNASEAISMAETTTSRELGAKEAIEGIRSPLSNGQLMEKFKISPQGFADLIKQLFENKLITENDLSRRGIRFKIIKKQAPQETIAPPSPNPAGETAQTIAPPSPNPDEETEEFLDTVTLTDMLTFKNLDEPPVESTDEPTEIPPPEPVAEELSEKKSRFSITGFFKKAK